MNRSLTWYKFESTHDSSKLSNATIADKDPQVHPLAPILVVKPKPAAASSKFYQTLILRSTPPRTWNLMRHYLTPSDTLCTSVQATTCTLHQESIFRLTVGQVGFFEGHDNVHYPQVQSETHCSCSHDQD